MAETTKPPPAIKRLSFKASRFPWQAGYNWHGMLNSSAPLNQPRAGKTVAPRFGGGWEYKLGFSWSSGTHGWTLMLDCLVGMVSVYYQSAAAWTRAREREAQQKEALDSAVRAVEESRARTAGKVFADTDIPF